VTLPRALVVDDDPHILEVLAMRLESLGLQVSATAASAEVPALLTSRGFDVALFDLRMTPLDGLALLDVAREHHPHLPVLIMTAHATIEGAVEAIRRGAFDYLTKPFVPEELRGKITRALAERRWARDRALLGKLGTSLASGETVEGVLRVVVQTTMDATATYCASVFLRENGTLVLRAVAGTSLVRDAELVAAADTALQRGEPTAVPVAGGRLVLAAPLRVEGRLRGVLTAETAQAVVPTTDDLSLLALFASHAAIALRSSQDLEGARSGALAALGRVASQVAHEINNPLGGLKVYAALVGKRLATHGDRHGVDLAGKIGQAVDRLAALVSDITAYGRPAELRREATDPDELVQECLALVQDKVTERQVRVVCELDGALGLLMLDAREIHKALMNVLVNALEAMDADGTLTVQTLRDPDGGFRIRVADTGCGMDTPTLGRTYDLFFTTKSGGTGLGMAIVRSAVERHGGRVSIETAPGKGTTIEMLFPADDDAASAPDASRGSDGSAS
jgi:signal transduction histidine kinase